MTLDNPADVGYSCPTECDTDCDADCHEYHYVFMKRDHEPEDCPGLRYLKELP